MHRTIPLVALLFLAACAAKTPDGRVPNPEPRYEPDEQAPKGNAPQGDDGNEDDGEGHEGNPRPDEEEAPPESDDESSRAPAADGARGAVAAGAPQTSSH